MWLQGPLTLTQKGHLINHPKKVPVNFQVRVNTLSFQITFEPKSEAAATPESVQPQ